MVFAFRFQRWAHAIVFILATISYFANKNSAVPKGASTDDAISIRKVMGRDTGRKTFSRFCDTLSVFIYQTAVFVAQWNLVHANQCELINDVQICERLAGPEYFWVMMEALCFYSYMASCVAYIGYMQCRSACIKARHSDLFKQTEDYLTYDHMNLVWFAFNFVLIILPPCLIFGVPNDDPDYQLNHREGKASYKIVMYVIWFMHLFQFIFNNRIYVLRDSAQVDGEDDDY